MTWGMATARTTSLISARIVWHVPGVLSTARRAVLPALFLEGKQNLFRLRQDIPLTDAEANAIDDGVTAFEKLLAQLADTPTPAGSTPPVNSRPASLNSKSGKERKK